MIKAKDQTRHSEQRSLAHFSESTSSLGHSSSRSHLPSLGHLSSSGHSEFISESIPELNEILKRVQDDFRFVDDFRVQDDLRLQDGFHFLDAPHYKNDSRGPSNIKSPKGFTIVEIIFVIAIGGLILIMSFMAISSAQRSKRDAQRKTDLERINQNIVAWTNNVGRGLLPDTAANLSAAAGSMPNAPDGGAYSIVEQTVASLACASGSTNNIAYERTSDRSYKIKICLESGEYEESH